MIWKILTDPTALWTILIWTMKGHLTGLIKVYEEEGYERTVANALKMRKALESIKLRKCNCIEGGKTCLERNLVPVKYCPSCYARHILNEVDEVL